LKKKSKLHRKRLILEDKPFLYDRKVLLSYHIKTGVQRGRIPLAVSEGCSDSGGIVEGKLGFPSESVPSTLFCIIII